MSRTVRVDRSANATSRSRSSRDSLRRQYRQRRSPTPFYPRRPIHPEPISTPRRLRPHPPRSGLFTPTSSHYSRSTHHSLHSHSSRAGELAPEMPAHTTGVTESVVPSIDARNNISICRRTLVKLSPLSLTVEACREQIICSLTQIYCLVSDIENLIDIIEEDMEISQNE